MKNKFLRTYPHFFSVVLAFTFFNSCKEVDKQKQETKSIFETRNKNLLGYQKVGTLNDSINEIYEINVSRYEVNEIGKQVLVHSKIEFDTVSVPLRKLSKTIYTLKVNN